MSSVEKINIAIVGGGLSGLTTAKNLCSHVSDIHLFEAKEHLGGRTHTYYWNSQHSFEEGGTTIDSNHTFMISLANELNVPLIQQGMADGKISVIYQGESLSDNTIESLTESFKTLCSLTLTSMDSIYDIIRNIDDPMVKAFFQTYIKDECGIDDKNASLLLKPMLLRHTHNLHELVSSRNNPSVPKDFINQSAYTYRVAGGMSCLIDALKNHIQSKTSIHYNYILKKISKTDEGYFLEFLINNQRKIILTEKVVLTLPFSTLRDVEIDSTVMLSDLQHKAIKTLPYGTNAKIGIPVKGSFDMLYHINLDQQFISWSGHNAWTVMLGGTTGETLTQDQATHLICMAQSSLKASYPEIESLGSPIIKNWAQDEFAKGSYSTKTSDVFPEIWDSGNTPGQYKFAESIDDSLFIGGEHTRFDFTGHMEGAVRSGYECATALLKSL